MGSGKHGAVDSRTVGQYLAARIKEVGVKKFYAVPGDFNMGLLVGVGSSLACAAFWQVAVLAHRW